MAWNPVTIRAGAVVLDANAAVGIAAKEVAKEARTLAAIAQYTASGYLFFAPGAIVSEALYALCQQEQNNLLTRAEHGQAIHDLQTLLARVLPPPNGEASLILRADQIRAGYGCSRSADALYIALAEELSRTYTTRLLTFDQGVPKQATRHAPLVSVHLLT